MRRQKLFATQKWGLMLLAPKKLHLKRLISSLAFLKRTDPDNFENVIYHLDVVLVGPAPGSAGAITQEGFYICSSGFFDGRFRLRKKAWLASCFIHEVYHIRQHLAGWWDRLSNRRIEENASKPQIRYLSQVGQHKIVESFKRQQRKPGGWWNMNNPKIKKKMERLEQIHKKFARGEFDIQYVSNKNLR